MNFPVYWEGTLPSVLTPLLRRRHFPFWGLAIWFSKCLHYFLRNPLLFFKNCDTRRVPEGCPLNIYNLRSVWYPPDMTVIFLKINTTVTVFIMPGKTLSHIVELESFNN
jgi:hypothetical protein